jgi:hypothetical protein
MKAETFDDLIHWTRRMHGHLAQSLSAGASAQSTTRSELLMRYLAEHEAALERMVGGYEGLADGRALATWVYDYFTENPVDLGGLAGETAEDMTADEVSAAVFAAHRQLIELYRYLEGRAETSELRDLVKELLALEEHEAMRLAQQVNRLSEL